MIIEPEPLEAQPNQKLQRALAAEDLTIIPVRTNRPG